MFESESNIKFVGKNNEYEMNTYSAYFYRYNITYNVGFNKRFHIIFNEYAGHIKYFGVNHDF